MKILNLYAGVGGNRKLWEGHEVTAVEHNNRIADIYERLYPDDRVVRGDAHQFLVDYHGDFDLVWSSPPCQSHTAMTKATRHVSQQSRYPDMSLYEEIIFLQHRCKGKWVVENVIPFYGVMRPDNVHVQTVGRHVFWSNFYIYANDVPLPKDFIYLADVAGKKKMQEWLGIHYEENVYYEGNHCPAQILRNAVHPKIGLDVLLSAENSGAGFVQDSTQIGMFL